MAEKWLAVVIGKGMFSDEVVVSVRQENGQEIAVFVPKNYVDENRGKMKVKVFERGDQSWAILPNETSTTVPVREGDLAAA